MQFTAETKKLAAAFSAASRFREGRTKPILGNVHCVAADGVVSLTATNLEASARMRVEGCDVPRSGSCLLDGERVGRFLGLLDGERVEVEAKNNKLSVASGNDLIEMATSAVEEFPLPKFEGEESFTVPARSLSAAISRTMFATDSDNNRFTLGGMLLDADKGNVVMVGTDGRRLSMFTLPCTAKLDGKPIIPASLAKMLLPLLTSGDVGVRLSASNVTFDLSLGTISLRLLEGRFPPWRDTLSSKRTENAFVVPVAALTAAVRRAAVSFDREAKDEQFPATGIDLTASAGELRLAASGKVAKSAGRIPIASEADHGSARLRGEYLSDVLSALSGIETVAVTLSADKANYIDAGADGLFLIMPQAN